MCFEEIVTILSPKIKSIAHRLNGRYTFFNDDDLYQEALVYLWLSHDKGALKDKTTSYILQGCFFHMKNYIRKNADKMRMLNIDAFSAGDDSDDRAGMEYFAKAEDTDIINSVDGDLLTEFIRSKGLSEREAMALNLSIEGLTIREIAQILGVSHVMVLKIKARIKDKCRDLRGKLE